MDKINKEDWLFFMPSKTTEKIRLFDLKGDAYFFNGKVEDLDEIGISCIYELDLTLSSEFDKREVNGVRYKLTKVGDDYKFFIEVEGDPVEIIPDYNSMVGNLTSSNFKMRIEHKELFDDILYYVGRHREDYYISKDKQLKELPVENHEERLALTMAFRRDVYFKKGDPVFEYLIRDNYSIFYKPLNGSYLKAFSVEQIFNKESDYIESKISYGSNIGYYDRGVMEDFFLREYNSEENQIKKQRAMDNNIAVHDENGRVLCFEDKESLIKLEEEGYIVYTGNYAIIPSREGSGCIIPKLSIKNLLVRFFDIYNSNDYPTDLLSIERGLKKGSYSLKNLENKREFVIEIIEKDVLDL